MSWLDNLFKRSTPSAKVAKSRLKVAISIDRSNLTPEMLSMLQDDIVRAISQRLDIDTEGMKIHPAQADINHKARHRAGKGII